MEYIKVYFEHSNKIFYAKTNSKLSDICSNAGYPLNLVCGGKGTCGKCKVLIKKNGIEETVLACMTNIKENITVSLKSEDIKEDSTILTSGGFGYKFNTSLRKIFVNKEELELNHCGYLWESIENNYEITANYAEISQFNKIMNNENVTGFTIIKENNKATKIQKGNTTEKLYGAAIDIGTTSVVMYLYDMQNGKLIGTYSNLNSQITKGADVISRITYCSNNENGTKELQSKIISDINSMIKVANEKHSAVRENLFKIVVCGNSTMQHLFHGLNPKRLGFSPFLLVYKDTIISRAKELGINCEENSEISFLPLLGGFVGADTTSVLMSIEKDDKLRLIVDLGTNGEIAIGNRNKYVVSSTACGPALEGAGLEYGMRGSKGALEKFEIIEGEPRYEIIGNIKAKGICGSGIVDIIAELIKNGVIEKSGRILTKDKFEKKYPNNKLSNFISKSGTSRSFIVVPPNDSISKEGIHVTQKDIRQVQLAKSAIFTGCIMLIEKYGIKGEDLDEILLAGAFGNYINIKNAEYIGLIPKFINVNVRSIGNAAGTGVQMYLLNEDEEINCENIVKNTSHLELASDPMFQSKYVMNMSFKEGE